MSNSLLYDPLLVGYLAEELDRRLRGRACAAALAFPGQRSAVLALDRGEALSLDLHPRRGWIRLIPWEHGDELDAVCTGVTAPPDERLLTISLRIADRYRPEERRVVAELATNQWNALLLGEDGRILSLAWSRNAGERSLRSGTVYLPSASRPRYGASEVTESDAWEVWRSALAGSAPESRKTLLVDRFAYTGSINAGFVLGREDREPSEEALRTMFSRWWWLRARPEADPVVLRIRGRAVPYPLALEGVPYEPAASLLAAMNSVAGAVEAPVEPGDVDLASLVQARLAAASRRVARLEEELAEGPGSAELRARADLLLTHLHAIRKGAELVSLVDWEGHPMEIRLDPSLAPAENAARLYAAAKRRGRAEEQIPQLLEKARDEATRWSEALSRTEAGDPPEWVRERLSERESTEPARASPGESNPYRTYRTSGGIEVRVGKTAKDNDRLTFHHARPDEVWLHARSVPGSHVILRWSDPEASPPARDLEEAATLAALFSRARSSSLVPVDWTRRKYVRKPRGAAPGAVVPQRVRTIFVEPDEAIVDRLRAD